jgi:hypothetical protein
MHYRIYPNPFTLINDHWLLDNNKVNGYPSESYCDGLILTKPGHFHTDYKDLQSPQQQMSAIDIITETMFDYPHPCVTEKILKPLLSKRMFIVVGAPNLLEWLHHKGFKTFTPFIDESYDSIVDPVERITAITTEIDRLCGMNINDIKKAVILHSDILEHNFTNLKNLEKTELQKIKDMISKL